MAMLQSPKSIKDYRSPSFDSENTKGTLGQLENRVLSDQLVEASNIARLALRNRVILEQERYNFSGPATLDKQVARYIQLK